MGMRTKNKKRSIFRRLATNTRLLGLTFALLVSAVGTYVVIRASAEEPIYYGYYDDVVGVIDSWPSQAGALFNVTVNAHYQHKRVQPTQLLLLLTSHREQVEHLGFTCTANTPCYKNTTHNGSLPPSGAINYVNEIICFDMPFNTMVNQNLGIVHYKSKRALTLVGGPSIFAYWTGVAPGTCAQNQDGSGVWWDSGTGSCGGSQPQDNNPCDTGSAIGTGPGSRGGNSSGQVGTGNGTSGTGTITSTGTSATSSPASGSTATNQSSQPNPLPNTGPQGEADTQKTLDPSPFFDGKEYKPGSEGETVASRFADNLQKSRATQIITALIVLVFITGLSVVGYRIHKHKGNWLTRLKH